MKFEQQLEAIKNKADLHKWVDELPDDATGLVLIRNPAELHACGEKHESYSYREIGAITVEESVYMARSWEHWMLSAMVQD
jgi:hypothetical protein